MTLNEKSKPYRTIDAPADNHGRRRFTLYWTDGNGYLRAQGFFARPEEYEAIDLAREPTARVIETVQDRRRRGEWVPR
jgi:hypothetical protein